MQKLRNSSTSLHQILINKAFQAFSWRTLLFFLFILIKKRIFYESESFIKYVRKNILKKFFILTEPWLKIWRVSSCNTTKWMPYLPHNKTITHRIQWPPLSYHHQGKWQAGYLPERGRLHWFSQYFKPCSQTISLPLTCLLFNE